MRTILTGAVLLAGACQATDPRREAQPPEVPASVQAESPEPAEPGWSVRYRFPIGVGYTKFRLGEGTALDNLTTLSVVPTAEFIRPLSERWTLLPFVGLGGGWLIDDGKGIAILTGGVRAEWLHDIDARNLVRVVPRVRYDANLTRADGLLGDWGRCDLAVELRHSMGRSTDRVRFSPGIYAQGFWFWDDIDLEIPGLTPQSASSQVEIGLSLGTRDKMKILGLPVPRTFIGIRFGDGIETISIRFGEL